MKLFPKDKHVQALVILLGFLVVPVIGAALLKDSPAPPSPRQEKINRIFSPWDGSCRPLEKIIKESMNDPNSYEHVSTIFWDKGDFLLVETTFRGKNAFGGIVTNSRKARVGLDGNVILGLPKKKTIR